MGLQTFVLFMVCSIAGPMGTCTLSKESEQPVEAPDMNAFWAAHVAHRQSGDLDAATSILANDCVLFEPFQPPVSGRENIVPKMREALAKTEVHDLSFESQEVYQDGTWLVDFGTFSETFSLEGKEERHVVEGNYAAVLERNPDGDWKVKRFMPLPSNSLSSE